VNIARAVVVVAACALVACSHGVRAAPSRADLDNPGSSSDGGRLYVTNCSSCHQLDGKGVPGAFPALAGNPVVTGNPRRVIAAVKFGVRSAVRAPDGLGGAMPAWEGRLSDGDIADVVTYVRFAWHNGAAPVSGAEVRSVKQARPRPSP
jgi:alcohol dehydrogenase (quinone), cytochrome c subunit